MSDAPTLFDHLADAEEPLDAGPAVAVTPRSEQRARARAGRDHGIAQADEHTDDEWRTQAWRVLLELAATRDPFIGDDVWDELDRQAVPEPQNLRALGPLMQRAARRGLIAKTGGLRPSVRSHLSPKPLWAGTGAEPQDL